MELNNIESLLEAYFEGETTLAQEQALRSYFTSKKVAEHLEVYTPLFKAYAQAETEKFTGNVQLPKSRLSLSWIPFAASIAILMGVFFYKMNTNMQTDYGTYDDPEVAILKTRQAMAMISGFMTKGAENLEVLEEFEVKTSEYIK